MTPRSTSGQKSQKNFRLSATCVSLLERLATMRGITEANMIELMVRDYAEHEDLNRFKGLLSERK